MGVVMEEKAIKGKVLMIPPIDKTLSIEGAAADAKTTGESIKKLENNIKNKPTGTYVGNGSSERRVIETEATSKVLMVESTAYVALVYPFGAMISRKDGSETVWSPDVIFTDDLCISTDHVAINALDVTYSYQVL